MKKAWMNISHFRFVLFNLKIFDEIVTTVPTLFKCLFFTIHYIIIIFIYLPSDVISQEKNATSSRSITKASKYAIPLKPNTQTCRVKPIFSHLVRRQRRTERSSKSTATSPS